MAQSMLNLTCHSKEGEQESGHIGCNWIRPGAVSLERQTSGLGSCITFLPFLESKHVPGLKVRGKVRARLNFPDPEREPWAFQARRLL
eukprot:1137957-Pelagomonas_calceolata.AAC.3